MTTETKILTDEQVGDLYQDWYCFFKDNPGSAAICIRAIEQAVLQSEQVQAWKEDAERYRWLRTPPNNLDPSFYGATGGLLRRDEYLDAAIDVAMDAAMEKQP